MTPLTRDVFDGATAERRLTSFFAVATSEAFGALTRLELTAAAACVTYVERTQIGKRPPLSPPLRESAGATMAIDQATRGNLELMRTLSGERRGSLLDAIDRTVTVGRLAAAGATAVGAAHRSGSDRATARRGRQVSSTTRRRAPIRARGCRRRPISRARCRGLRVGRGGPRDLAAIRDGVLAAADLARALGSLKETPAEIAEAMQACRRPTACWPPNCRPRSRPNCPPSSATAASCARATTRRSTRRARCAMNRAASSPRLQARYAEDTGVRVLKIRHNNVLGYFVEVTAQHGDKLMAAPLNATFIHRQTLAGQVRFTTTELGELEAKIASAADRALGLELEIFERLSASVIAQSDNIKECAEALARLDVASALAQLAAERDYARPQVDDSHDFVIEGGRHPVVEQALSRDGTPFVANDCDLSPPQKPKPAASG